MLIHKRTNWLVRSADGPRRAGTGPGPGPGAGPCPGPGPGPRVLSESADMRTLRKDSRHREAASNEQRDVRHRWDMWGDQGWDRDDRTRRCCWKRRLLDAEQMLLPGVPSWDRLTASTCNRTRLELTNSFQSVYQNLSLGLLRKNAASANLAFCFRAVGVLSGAPRHVDFKSQKVLLVQALTSLV